MVSQYFRSCGYNVICFGLVLMYCHFKICEASYRRSNPRGLRVCRSDLCRGNVHNRNTNDVDLEPLQTRTVGESQNDVPKDAPETTTDSTVKVDDVSGKAITRKHFILESHPPKMLFLLCNFTNLDGNTDNYHSVYCPVADHTDDPAITNELTEYSQAHGGQTLVDLCTALKTEYTDRIRNYILLSTAHRLSSNDDPNSLKIIQDKYEDLLKYFESYARCHKRLSQTSSLSEQDLIRFESINKILSEFTENYEQNVPVLHVDEDVSDAEQLANRNIDQPKYMSYKKDMSLYGEPALFYDPKTTPITTLPLNSPKHRPLIKNLLLRRKPQNRINQHLSNEKLEHENYLNHYLEAKPEFITSIKNSVRSPYKLTSKTIYNVPNQSIKLPHIFVPPYSLISTMDAPIPHYLPLVDGGYPQITLSGITEPRIPNTIEHTTGKINELSPSSLTHQENNLKFILHQNKTAPHIVLTDTSNKKEELSDMMERYLLMKKQYAVESELFHKRLKIYQQQPSEEHERTLQITLNRMKFLYNQQIMYHSYLEKNHITPIDTLRGRKHDAYGGVEETGKEELENREFNTPIAGIRVINKEEANVQIENATQPFLDLTKDNLIENIYTAITGYKENVEKYKKYNNVYANVVHRCSTAKEECDYKQLKLSQLVLKTIIELSQKSYQGVIDSCITLIEMTKSSYKLDNAPEKILHLFNNHLEMYNKLKELYKFYGNMRELIRIQSEYNTLINMYVKLLESLMAYPELNLTLPRMPLRPDVELHLKLSMDAEESEESDQTYLLYIQSLQQYYYSLQTYHNKSNEETRIAVYTSYIHLLMHYGHIYRERYMNRMENIISKQAKVDVYVVPHIFEETASETVGLMRQMELEVEQIKKKEFETPQLWEMEEHTEEPIEPTINTWNKEEVTEPLDH